MKRQDLRSSGKGYCRYGKHGPRKLYRVESHGQLVGHFCYECCEKIASNAAPPRRNPQKIS